MPKHRYTAQRRLYGNRIPRAALALFGVLGVRDGCGAAEADTSTAQARRGAGPQHAGLRAIFAIAVVVLVGHTGPPVLCGWGVP